MKRIALVEDNPDNRLLIQAFLEELYQLAEYADGSEGLDGIRREPPDLVLLDISLPRMDGEQVLREIRNDSLLRGLPVIALTAHTMPGDRERFLSAGFDDYIPKPILDDAELVRVIERCLGDG